MRIEICQILTKNATAGLRAFVKKGNEGPTNEELLEDVEMQEK